MTTPDDAYWDELGIAWCAINPEINVIAPRLKARLRLQSLGITAGLVLGYAFSATGVLLGVFTIWQGWATGAWNFVTRGIAIAVIAVIVAVAASLLLPVRTSDATKALSEMLDLAIARAQRTLKTIQLGFYACAVAAVLGLVGTAIRTALTGPPRLSPMVDLAVLALFALGLLIYGRHIRVNLQKLHYLRRALAPRGES